MVCGTYPRLVLLLACSGDNSDSNFLKHRKEFDVIHNPSRLIYDFSGTKWNQLDVLSPLSKTMIWHSIVVYSVNYTQFCRIFVLELEFIRIVQLFLNFKIRTSKHRQKTKLDFTNFLLSSDLKLWEGLKTNLSWNWLEQVRTTYARI